MQAAVDRHHDPDVSNRALLDALAPYEVLTTFNSGRVLFDEGVTPTGVHVLLSGDVDLKFSSRVDTEPIRLSEGGTVLGLSSMVAWRGHEYTATAVGPVMTGFVDRETFLRVLDESPTRWFDVLQILSRDISSCYDRVRELSERRRWTTADHRVRET
jgi:CRP-like cAMP-binding protein